MFASTLVAVMQLTSAAAIIGTGLDGRQGVFVQEFHQGDRVKYLIANTGDKTSKLSVVKFDQTWRLGQPIGKVIAGPWEIPAKAAKEFDVTDLAGGELLRFFNADNSPLGVLHAPRKPDADVGKNRIAAGGLNGMGNYIDGVSVELPATAVKPGAEVVVRVRLLDSARGTFKFSPLTEPNPAAGPQLHPEKVACASLPVRKDGDMWVIDCTQPTKAEAHLVELTFRVPAEHKQPLFTFSAWMMNTMGGGTNLARAVEVGSERVGK